MVGSEVFEDLELAHVPFSESLPLLLFLEVSGRLDLKLVLLDDFSLRNPDIPALCENAASARCRCCSPPLRWLPLVAGANREVVFTASASQAAGYLVYK